MPPLRERREDIPRLSRHFLDRAARRLGNPSPSASPGFLEQAMAYDWPGNVRELENFVERAAILARAPLERANRCAPASQAQTASLAPRARETLEEIERDHILRVLEETHWAIEGEQGAARTLGLNPSTLRGRLRKLGIRKTS